MVQICHIMNWKAGSDIARFDFKMEYRPGKANGNADGLSRRTHAQEAESSDSSENVEAFAIDRLESGEDEAEAETSGTDEESNTDVATEFGVVMNLPCLDPENLEDLQCADPSIDNFIKWLKDTVDSDELTAMKKDRQFQVLWNQREKLEIRNGVLVRVHRREDGETHHQFVLPTLLRERAMKALHDDMGHQGIERTSRLVKQRCYWPGMDRDIKEYCQNCQRCVVAKAVLPKVRMEMKPLVAHRPFEILTMDFTVLEPTTSGKENVLVVTDVFSKFTWAFATKDQKAATVAKILVDEIFNNFEAPKRLHTDQGPQFQSTLIQYLCRIWGISKSRTTPYYPAGNGQCERFHRTLHQLLQTLSAKHKRQWDKHLENLVFIYNKTPNSTTGFSPHFLIFGREPRLPIDWLLPGSDDADVELGDWVADYLENLRSIWTLANQNLRQRDVERKQWYDRKLSGSIFNAGQRVLVRNLHLKGRHKIQDNWMGTIYIVTDRLNEEGSVYTVVPEDGSGEAKVLHRMHLRLAPGEMAQQSSDVESACESHVGSESEGHGSISASRSPNANGSAGLPSGTSDDPDSDIGNAQPAPGLRRSTRATAGKHSNPYRLPRAVSGV